MLGNKTYRVIIDHQGLEPVSHRKAETSWATSGHIHIRHGWFCWLDVLDVGGSFFLGHSKVKPTKVPYEKTRCLLQVSENTRLLLVQWWARAANRYSKQHDGQAWIQANRCGQADLGRCKSCWNMLRSGWAIVRIRETKVTKWPEKWQYGLFAWEFTSKHMKAWHVFVQLWLEITRGSSWLSKRASCSMSWVAKSTPDWSLVGVCKLILSHELYPLHRSMEYEA